MGKSANSPPARKRSIRSTAPGDDPRPLSARDVAELCGVELKTIHNWVAQGLLPHFRTPGRHLRFQPVDVQRFLRESGDPQRAPAATVAVLVVARQSSQGAIARHLRGCAIEHTADPYKALVAAGRTGPRLVVLEPQLFRGLDAARYIRALRDGLPSVAVVWLSEKPPRGDRSVVAVSPRERRRLATLVPKP